ncbi:MAG: hypothetical protein M1417_00035, partial [Candidatus Thermoplasmatota archaeon]|nr:hypothetical protein [Candidatus Thermoplasmatota archaeon]
MSRSLQSANDGHRLMYEPDLLINRCSDSQSELRLVCAPITFLRRMPEHIFPARVVVYLTQF